MEALSDIQRLMVKACITTSHEEQAAAVKEWEEKVVMDVLDYSCMRFCPLFFYKNQKAGIETRHDKRLKVIYRFWWLKTEHILNQMKLVHAEFISAGIQPVMIKGASVMFYYPVTMLRTMADFDLMIPFPDISRALEILKSMGYTPDPAMEEPMKIYPVLVRDFTHSLECVHEKTGTRLDLHWRIGNLCSYEFTNDLLQHVEACLAIPHAQRPDLAHELCATIIHAVVSGGRDNINWIYDVHLMNTLMTDTTWQKARQIAIEEKKEHIFDDGCNMLADNGVYVPFPKKEVNFKRQPFLSNAQIDAQSKNLIHYFYLRSKNYTLIMKNLFPHSGMPKVYYQGLRRIFLFLVFRGVIKD